MARPNGSRKVRGWIITPKVAEQAGVSLTKELSKEDMEKLLAARRDAKPQDAGNKSEGKEGTLVAPNTAKRFAFNARQGLGYPSRYVAKEGKSFVAKGEGIEKKSFSRKKDAVEYAKNQLTEYGLNNEKTFLRAASKAISDPSSDFRETGIERFTYSAATWGAKNTVEIRRATLTSASGEKFNLVKADAPIDAPVLVARERKISSGFTNSYYDVPLYDAGAGKGLWKIDYDVTDD